MRKSRGSTLIEAVVALGILMIALGMLNTLASTVIRLHKYIENENRRLDVINMVSKELLFNVSTEELVPLQQQIIRLDSNNINLLIYLKNENAVDALLEQNTTDGDVEFTFTKEELWRIEVHIYKHNGRTYLCSFYKGELF